MMKFITTRCQDKEYTFEEALFSPGYVAGGLLLPKTIPQISQEVLKSWLGLSLPQVCKQILPLFISGEEISQEDLEALIDDAYSRLPLDQVAALSSFPNGLNVLELGNTKTLAFKDLSTFIMARLLEFYFKKREKHVTILVGTSGDTGPSSIEAIRGSGWMDIVVLFPKGYCTEIQEIQMTTVMDENVHVYSVEGCSDDVDEPIKAVCLDQDFKAIHNLCTMNSINMCRVLCQIVAYFYGYLKVCRSVGDEVEIVVPTGAAGNITGGCLAYRMGLPIKLVCTVNSNDLLHRMLSTGELSTAPSVIKTYSVAMDIQNPYNIERIFSLFSNRDTALVKKIMEEFETGGKTTLPASLLQKMQKVLSSASFDNQTVLKTMQRCWSDHHYLICPHTAVAVSYYFSKLDRMEANQTLHQPTLCFASAHPAKFPEALVAAGLEPKPTPYITNLQVMPKRCLEMKRGQNWEKILREKIKEISKRAGVDQ
ncbi:threonine synthase-like 2 [Acanthaster planci]|uniref:Threonine synthase-like 2 n=1 Tax=Acanthaster planci TaxID=133434 RepID=A0A8B7ZQ13_ACAPL|nr:threonine synthase-like 2 [Acanthaster planci]